MGPRESKAQLGELDACYSLSSFLKDVMKMADIDIDPFSDHNKTDEPMGKTTPLTSGGGVTGGGGRSYLGTRARNVVWRDEY